MQNNKNKIIIGLVGQIACGKGTVAKYLEKNHEASTFRFSTILRNILGRLHKEVSRKNLQKLSTSLRQTFGEDTLAKVIAKDVKNSDKKIIVVDGIRRMEDIKYLKEIPGFKLTRVVVESKIRYERLTKRSENSDDQEKTFEDFLEDEKRETELEIPVVMRKAELEIDNNSSPEDLINNIKELLKTL